MRSFPGSFATFTLAVLLAACGGGGGSFSTGSSNDSSVTISFTDAPSDEVAMFEVDVTDVVLERISGSDVSVLAKKTRVDFAQLTDVGDLVTGGGIPSGFYTGMTMTLDFTNAVVLLNGKTTPASVVDANGNPITGAVAVSVSFPSSGRPQARARRNHLFELDLDLNDAVVVDSTLNKVTFTPVLSAELDPSAPREVWRSGYLSAVDTSGGTFTVQRKATDSSSVGDYTVASSATTIYHVDGVAYVGVAGLTTLAAKTLGTTMVHVQGTVDRDSRILNAKWVEAGNGVRGNGQDWVEGLVTARTGAAGANAALTVLGHSRESGSGSRSYNTAHTVTVTYATTHVLRRGAITTLTTDHLQVGQRVLAFGTLTGTTLDASTASGVVREVLTDVYGTANSAPTGSVLTLNLSRIGLRPISDFDFTVGGLSQASPSAFTVDVTGLATGAITSNSKVRALGWMKPVGSGGGVSDFTAHTLVDRSSTAQVLVMTWNPASATALPTITATSIALDASTADKKFVEDGFAKTTIQPTPVPLLRPASTTGRYRIQQDHGCEVHTSFASFADALSSRIDATHAVRGVSAFVTGSGGTQIYDVSAMSVVLR